MSDKQSKPATNTAFFEITEDGEGKWHWCLWSGNGRAMARNPGEYERRKDVIQAVRNLRKLVPTVKLVVQSSREAPDEPEPAPE